MSKNRASQYIAVRKQFDKERKEEGELYLHGFRKRKEDLSSFIRNFFLKYNNEKPTYIVDKEGNTQEFCEVGKRRSLQDLYKISKTYYPEARLKDIKQELNKWMSEKTLRCTYCKMVEKQVYFTITPDEWKIITLDNSNKDETGLWVLEE